MARVAQQTQENEVRAAGSGSLKLIQTVCGDPRTLALPDTEFESFTSLMELYGR